MAEMLPLLCGTNLLPHSTTRRTSRTEQSVLAGVSPVCQGGRDEVSDGGFLYIIILSPLYHFDISTFILDKEILYQHLFLFTKTLLILMVSLFKLDKK